MVRGGRLRVGHGQSGGGKAPDQGQASRPVRGLRPAEGPGPMSLYRRLKGLEMIGQTARVRFPDRTVERLTLSDNPEVGKSIDARGARWRITTLRLPWGLDHHDDVVYDIDVEPVIPPSNG